MNRQTARVTCAVSLVTSSEGGKNDTRIFRILFGVTLALAIAVLLLVIRMPAPAHAGGSVTTCTEAGLDAALSGGGMVMFNCGGTNSPATIILTSQKTITAPTTIDGGSVITFSGGNSTSLFLVNSAVTLTLNAITLTEGLTNGNGGCLYVNGTLVTNAMTVTNCTGAGASSFGGGIYVGSAGRATLVNSRVMSNTTQLYGGGVYNYGTLTLDNSTVISNSAYSQGGGILNYVNSTLTLNSSRVNGNYAPYGGGIYSISGTLMITNSTISGNSAGRGGGIDNHGSANLIGVTVSGNTSTNGGGGIANDGAGIINGALLNLNNSTLSGNSVTGFARAGGGIINGDVATVTVTNTTISGNSAYYGGGIYNSYIGTLTNVTLSGNNGTVGGGIVQDSSYSRTITLTNTIIVRGSMGGNCHSFGMPFASNGYNLSSDGTCATYLNQTGDLNNTNPNLGPLANNGGPTQTHALLPGSPAIDQIPVGTNGCGTSITADQRGAQRPIGPTCDMGAYEAGYLFLPLILR